MPHEITGKVVKGLGASEEANGKHTRSKFKNSKNRNEDLPANTKLAM